MIPDGHGGARAGRRHRGTSGRFLLVPLFLVAVILLSPGCLSSPRPGSIAVTSSPPGATVYLGGAPAGTAPLEIPNLTPGDYVLLLRMTGYGDREVRVKVTEGNCTSVTARYPALATPTPSPTPLVTVIPTTPTLPFVVVTPEPGSLFVTSFPSGASVAVNGVEMGRTPLLVPNLTPGTYYLRYSMVGWKTSSSIVSVSSGQMMTDYVTLRQ